MKPLKESFPDIQNSSISYEELLDSIGYNRAVQEDSWGYQGDSLVMFIDGERIGYLCYGWGSCSVCDALQGCYTYEEFDNLRNLLHNSIIWQDSEEAFVNFLDTHDWEGDYIWHTGVVADFIKRCKEYLEVAHVD